MANWVFLAVSSQKSTLWKQASSSENSPPWLSAAASPTPSSSLYRLCSHLDLHPSSFPSHERPLGFTGCEANLSISPYWRLLEAHKQQSCPSNTFPQKLNNYLSNSSLYDDDDRCCWVCLFVLNGSNKNQKHLSLARNTLPGRAPCSPPASFHYYPLSHCSDLCFLSSQPCSPACLHL